MSDDTSLPPPLSEEMWRHVGGPSTVLYGNNNANGRHPTDRPSEPSVQGIPGLVRLSDVRPEVIRWLWPGRIPLGKLTVIDGDPGLGKSMITCDLAARVSAGLPMPDNSTRDLSGPQGVVLLSAEDGLADTIRPRLDAAGADTKRVAALQFVKTPGNAGNAGNADAAERLPTLADIADLERAIIATQAALVVIDPLMAYLPGQVKANQDQDVRGALAPLSKLAERTGAAVVVVRHLNKGGGSANPIYRGGGSIGIIGAARCGLLVARDPDDVTGARRIVAVVKSNLAAMPSALAYTIEPTARGAARVAWQGETEHTAAMLLAIAEDSEARDALSEAVQFLRDTLAEGRMLSDDVQKQARQFGIKDATLRRARSQLGIKPIKEGFGSGGRWCWELPALEPPPP